MAVEKIERSRLQKRGLILMTETGERNKAIEKFYYTEEQCFSEKQCAEKCGNLTMEGSIYCESCKEFNEANG